MKRTAVNPWPWSHKFGYNQAEIIEDARRQLICAGQTSVDAEGQPLHVEDMRSQMVKTLDNLEAVLLAADMELGNVVRLLVCSTDMEETLKHFDVFATRFGAAGVTPPMTLLGVVRLALPPLMFEVEATAVD